jgi:lipopolysaccharide/colanic/teichoic acid biosynthesis glycosyltransferase
LYAKFIKRGIDIVVSAIVLLLFLPVLLLISAVLAVVTHGKPFFFQVRPGLHATLFNIVKFKTMTDRKDADGNLLPDAQRLTKIGAFVRKTSLDEMPQLINVFKGDMSLIGPRPLLPEYLPLYNNEQKKRHLVRPGISGWAQVNGRNAISWQQKFDYDVWYVKNISFLLDVKIVFLTIKKVLVRDGISSDSSVTMEKFKGN